MENQVQSCFRPTSQFAQQTASFEKSKNWRLDRGKKYTLGEKETWYLYIWR